MKIQSNSHSKESRICFSTGEDVLKGKDYKVLQSAGQQHSVREVTVEEMCFSPQNSQYSIIES